MNLFAELTREIKQRPGHAYVESVTKNMSRGGRPSNVPLPAVDNPWGLSPSECAVMKALSSGLTIIQAGERLGIVGKTVELHLKNAKARMGQTSRVLAILEWDRFMRGAA